MKKPVTIGMMLVLAASAATAQRTLSDDDIAELQDRSAQFMALILDGSYSDAFDVVRSYPVAITEENLASLQDTVENQLDSIISVYGDKLEVQYIGYNSVSDFLARFIYVVRYEYHFLWWQQVFYRGAEDEWLLSSIAFDDDTKELIDQTF